MKNAGKVVEEFKDLKGNSVQFYSGQRVVVLGQIPLTSIAPGKYTLEVTVQDKISNRTIVTSTDFKINTPIQTAVAATP